MQLIRVATCLCLAFCLAACSARYGVRPADPARQMADWGESALTSGAPSERTKLYLKSHDLIGAFESDPVGVLTSLDDRMRARPDRDTLFALMELCHLAAKDKALDKDLSRRLYASSAVYAYGFLFDEALPSEPDQWTPYRRMACEFYNLSLADAARQAVADGDVPAEARLLRGSLRFSGFSFDKAGADDRIARVSLAYDYRAVGLDSQVRAFGVGVPLIVERVADLSVDGGAAKGGHQARQVYAATAVVRLDKLPYRLPADTPAKAKIEVYHPTKTADVEIGGRKVPLEADLSTPLAYLLSRMPDRGGFLGLRRVAEQERYQGLYLLEPYDPDKIPVVFVHGLLSSPRTWVGMFNALMADETLRLRYQFWFYLYPTGNPILISAANLRKELTLAVARFDPAGANVSLRRMVLVGHSMGGLLTKFMVQDGGEPLWSAISKAPPDSLNLGQHDRALIQDTFFFKRLPFISRAVFLATPHRGASMADAGVGRLGSFLVRLPAGLLRSTGNLLGALAGGGQGANFSFLTRYGGVPTGIDGLSPDNPVLAASVAIGVDPAVVFHSIIGNREAAVPGGTDGVVAYASSHLDGAVSELVVRSDHGVHTRPLAILEVRRILLEHLRECGPAAPGGR